MKSVSLSVIIPFYNGGRFLAEAFAMLARQTYTDFEVVVVDDGSNQQEARLAKQLTATNNGRFVCQQNAGPGIARNHGARVAQGEFLAFLDVDDLWTPDKLEKQIVAFSTQPDLDVVLCESEITNELGASHGSTRLSSFNTAKEKLINEVVFGRVQSFTSSIVTRKSFFKRIGGFDPGLRFREDHLFLLRALLEGNTVVLPEVLSQRRLHLNSMSGVGLTPDLLANLHRAELFWTQAEKFVAQLPRRKLLAFEMRRLAKGHIVLGQSVPAIRACLAAFATEPYRPRHLAYILAALWVKIQPARFDHWHTGLAQVRKLR